MSIYNQVTVLKFNLKIEMKEDKRKDMNGWKYKIKNIINDVIQNKEKTRKMNKQKLI